MKRSLLFFTILLALAETMNAQSIPNYSFENWTSHAHNEPDSGWFTSNQQSLALADSLTVWKVTGQTGQAVHIQTAILGTDTLQAYITNSLGDPSQGMGGVPFSQSPTAITGYYRYNLPGNDSALLWIVFKKNGLPVSSNIFKIRNATGSQATFTTFSFPISLSLTPDSVIIAASSSNLNVGGPGPIGFGIQSGSWLELDQLAFTGPGVTQAIPGGTFDLWTSQSLDKATGWESQPSGPLGSGVTKSTDHYAGSYSIQLVSQPGGGGGGGNLLSPAAITSGHFGQMSGPFGGLPYTHTVDTLTGWYKFTPVGADTGGIMVTLQHLGTNVGSGAYPFIIPASVWTYFEIPLSASSVPDTIRIDAISSIAQNLTVPGTTLKLDDLQLKSQPVTGIHSINALTSGIVVYPNPANALLNIKCNTNSTIENVRLYDITGKVFYEQAYCTNAAISISVAQLPAGTYFYEVRTNNGIMRDKFIKN